MFAAVYKPVDNKILVHTSVLQLFTGTRYAPVHKIIVDATCSVCLDLISISLLWWAIMFCGFLHSVSVEAADMAVYMALCTHAKSNQCYQGIVVIIMLQNYPRKKKKTVKVRNP